MSIQNATKYKGEKTIWLVFGYDSVYMGYWTSKNASGTYYVTVKAEGLTVDIK